jgi:histidinol-phosphate phosphatase family protein
MKTRAACRRSVARPTLFLDRDGTINRHIGYLHRPEQLELLPGAAAAIRRLNTAGALVIVVTNQPVVAMGLCTLAELECIHAKLEGMLDEEGAFLDALYACPHHPDGGSPGEAVEFKIACGCRKPKTGMIDAAVRDWAIDLRRSAVIGDSWRDIDLARQAGLPAFRIGEHGQETPPGVTPVAGLSEAVEHFLARIQDNSSSLPAASDLGPSPAAESRSLKPSPGVI